MTILQPYLTFAGDCEEAMNFYKRCLDGEITEFHYYEGSPIEVPDDYKKKVMHSTLRFAGGELMASDGMPDAPLTVGNNFMLSISLDDIAATERYFGGLSEGGKVSMPLQETFWATRFAMLTDKFGVQWTFNCVAEKS